MSLFNWKRSKEGEGASLPGQRTESDALERPVHVIHVPMDALVELYNTMAMDAGLKELSARELAERTQDPNSDPTILFAAGEIAGRNDMLRIFGGFILNQGGAVSPIEQNSQAA